MSQSLPHHPAAKKGHLRTRVVEDISAPYNNWVEETTSKLLRDVLLPLPIKDEDEHDVENQLHSLLTPNKFHPTSLDVLGPLYKDRFQQEAVLNILNTYVKLDKEIRKNPPIKRCLEQAVDGPWSDSNGTSLPLLSRRAILETPAVSTKKPSFVPSSLQELKASKINFLDDLPTPKWKTPKLNVDEVLKLGPPKWDKESKAKAKAYYTERFGDGSVFAKRTEGSVANAIFDRWAAEDQRLVETILSSLGSFEVRPRAPIPRFEIYPLSLQELKTSHPTIMRTDEGRNKVRINDMQDELSLEAGPVIGLLRGHLSQAQAQGEVHRDLLALESFSVIDDCKLNHSPVPDDSYLLRRYTAAGKAMFRPAGPATPIMAWKYEVIPPTEDHAPTANRSHANPTYRNGVAERSYTNHSHQPFLDTQRAQRPVKLEQRPMQGQPLPPAGQAGPVQNLAYNSVQSYPGLDDRKPGRLPTTSRVTDAPATSLRQGISPSSRNYDEPKHGHSLTTPSHNAYRESSRQSGASQPNLHQAQPILHQDSNPSASSSFAPSTQQAPPIPHTAKRLHAEFDISMTSNGRSPSNRVGPSVVAQIGATPSESVPSAKRQKVLASSIPTGKDLAEVIGRKAAHVASAAATASLPNKSDIKVEEALFYDLKGIPTSGSDTTQGVPTQARPLVSQAWRQNKVLKNPHWYNNAIGQCTAETLQDRSQVLVSEDLQTFKPLMKALKDASFDPQPMEGVEQVDLMMDPFTAAVFIKIQQFESQDTHEDLIQRIKMAARYFKTVIVVIEVVNYSAATLKNGYEQAQNPITAEIAKNLPASRRAMSTAAIVGEDEVIGKVRYVFALNGAREVCEVLNALHHERYARSMKEWKKIWGDERGEETATHAFYERFWLTFEPDAECRQAVAEMGLNTLTVLLIQHRCESLESFREGMTPEQRLSEFGPIVGHEIIKRYNRIMAEAQGEVQGPYSSSPPPSDVRYANGHKRPMPRSSPGYDTTTSDPLIPEWEAK